MGGGAGGVVAANTLRKRLPSTDRVVVVDREPDHIFAPSLLWIMIGNRNARQISRPLVGLARKGIEFLHGNVDGIDAKNRSVVVSGESYTTDALIIALGADYATEAVPGLNASGHNLYTLDGATAIRDSLESFSGGRIAIVTAEPMYKCPAAPYEAAMLIEYRCRRLGIREKVRIDLYAAESGPMGVAGQAVSQAVRKMVESKDIGYLPEHRISKADPESREIIFSNGARFGYDLLVFVPPHRAPSVLMESSLLGESGWISVDRHTLETPYDGVFAIGDATSIPLTMGKPLPKAGVFAHGQGETVANNIACEWTGKKGALRYDGAGKCFIEIGDSRAGLGSGNFYGEPAPNVRLRRPGVTWHLSKVLFEKYWLQRWL